MFEFPPFLSPQVSTSSLGRLSSPEFLVIENWNLCFVDKCVLRLLDNSYLKHVVSLLVIGFV